MKAVLMILLLLIAVGVPAPIAYVEFSRLSPSTRSMFYNTNYIEVVDARIRMGLHIPTEKDEFNTWMKMK